MQKNLAVTSSPHLRDKMSTQRIMQEVCLALAPAGIASIILFGANAAILIAASVITCVAAEYVWQKLNHQTITVADWSAVVTGLLLAYNLPATAPVWIAVVGGIIAIVLVKQCFGGIGGNFMNPALTARAILFVSWSTIMASYPQTRFAVDAVSSATPLSTLSSGSVGDLSFMNLLIGNCGGVLGETCKIALLLGGAYLIWRQLIDWRIPLAFIGTAFLCFLIKETVYQVYAGGTILVAFMGGFQVAVYQVFAGSMILGAFFMATDYVTSPVTHRGRVIMGVGCGLLIFVIRAFASYPEGCSFAILFMNVATPLIDRFTTVKPFGEVKKHG